MVSVKRVGLSGLIHFVPRSLAGMCLVRPTHAARDYFGETASHLQDATDALI